MGNFQQLRMQNVMSGYGQIPGGNMGYSDEDYGPNPSSPYTPGPGLEQVGDQQLGGEPESQPELANIQAPTVQAPTAAKYNADDSVKRTMELINQVYTPENASRDRFNRLLDAFPAQHNPTKSDRFSAVMMGLGAGGRQGGNALDTMDRILQGPYLRDVEEWKTKADPYGKAYQFENNSNTNERQLATGVVNTQMASDKLAEQARQADQRAKIQQEGNEIKWAVSRGWKNITGPNDPTYTLQSPDGTIRKTTVPTGSLIELEDIKARGDYAVRAADTRAASQAANSQGTPYEMEIDGKKVSGTVRNDTFYPLRVAQPGERPGQRQAPTAGPGTSVPITPPTGVPGAYTDRVLGGGGAGKITGPINRVGTEQEAKALTPQQQKVKISNDIQAIISGHPNWKDFVGYNEETHLFEGMLDPPKAPRTAGWFGIGGGGASAEEWQQYKDDMDGYNQLRAMLHPNLKPWPVVGGSNAEQRANKGKKDSLASPPDTSSKVYGPSPEPTRGIGPTGSTNAAPSGSGNAGIGPSTTPNNPKSLPGSGSTTKNAEGPAGVGQGKSSTWMPPNGGKYAFLPDSWNSGPKSPSDASSKSSGPSKVAPTGPATEPVVRPPRGTTTATTTIPQDRGGTGATPEYPYGTFGSRSVPPTTSTVPPKRGSIADMTREQNERPTTVFPTQEEGGLSDLAKSGIPPGARVMSNGNEHLYTTNNGKTWVMWDEQSQMWMPVKRGGR